MQDRFAASAIRHGTFIAALIPLLAAPVCAATLASDNASDAVYSSWDNADNGGTGFGAWTLSTAGTGGRFRGNSTGNGAASDSNADGDINSSGNVAWGMWANSGGTSNALRDLSVALAVNDEITVYQDNGYIDSGGTVGFGLQNASGNNVLEFYYVGGMSSYRYNNGTGADVSPTMSFTDQGVKVVVKLTSATTFSLTVTKLVDGSVSTASGTLNNPAGGQTISRLRLFNFNSGSGGTKDAFFNRLLVDSAPVVSSNVRQTPSAATTNASSVIFRVTFSETVTGVGTGDFSLTTSGISGASVSSVSPVSGTTYDVTVGTGTGDGTIRLDVPASASILNANGNDYAASYTSGAVYTIDKTTPTVSVNPLSTNDSTPTLSGNVNDAGATISVTVDSQTFAGTNNGSTWSATVPVALAQGTFDVSVTATDTATNAGSDATTNELDVDLTAPTVSVNSLTTGDSTPTLSGNINDAGATISVTVDSQTFAGTNNGSTWSATVPVALAQGTFDVSVTATDTVTNAGSDATTNELLVDLTAPTSSSSISDDTVIGTSVVLPYTANDTGGSGLSSTALFVKVPAGSFTNSGLSPSGGEFTYTAPADGRYEFYTVSTDGAGNAESAPGSPDAIVFVNTAANSTFVQQFTPTYLTSKFPMESSLDTTLTFDSVTVPGDVTISRSVPRAATPPGLNGSRLINQSWTITKDGSLAFGTATVVFGYDDAQLGTLLESEIDMVFSVDGGVVTGHPVTVNTVQNTLTVSGVTTFSEWFAGNNDAGMEDWTMLDE